MKRIILLVTLILGCGAYVGATHAIDAVKADMQIRTAESNCVASKIPLRYERSDIITGNGTCWIRGQQPK